MERKDDSSGWSLGWHCQCDQRAQEDGGEAAGEEGALGLQERLVPEGGRAQNTDRVPRRKGY